MSETSDTPRQEIKLFYCYAHEDKALRDELQVNLAGLRRQYQLTNWYDREILPGEKWEETIDKHLSTADVILLLISPHFVDSDYCYGKEMQRALARHHAGNCCVIPILLRPTYWEETPFSTIQMLPTDTRPITSWPDRYEAFHDVARGISTAIKALLTSRAHKTKEQWLNEGTALYNLKRYAEALAAFNHAIRLHPNYALAYFYKGTALNDLKRYAEALATFNHAIRLDPNDTLAYNNMGHSLYNLQRYEEALTAYNHAIRLDPNNIDAYHNKGTALNDLERYTEALVAFNHAIRLHPNDIVAHHNMGHSLYALKRYEEALAAYNHAIRLDPNYALAYYNMGKTLEALGRRKEAQLAFDKARQLGYTD